MTLPFSFAYAVGAVSCCFLWSRGHLYKPLLPLAGVMLSIAALNAYIELHQSGAPESETVMLALTLWFLVCYSILCLRLMQFIGIGIERWPVAFFTSWLHPMYGLAAAFIWGLRGYGSTETYAALVLVCVIHVPMFGAGKGQGMRFRASDFETVSPDKLLKWALACMAVPLPIILVGQLAVRNDWTLATLNFLMNASISSLFLIACHSRIPNSPEKIIEEPPEGSKTL